MIKKIAINDLAVKDVIYSLAKNFNTDIEEENNEFSMVVPKKFGSGIIKAYEFSNGVGVIHANYLLKDDLYLEFKKGVVQPLKILFNIENSFTHKFSDTKENHEIKRLENIIASGNHQHDHIFKVPANESVTMFSLEINRKLFEKKIESFLENMNDDLVELFRDLNGINSFFYKSQYSLDIAKFIQEFTSCELTGFMKSVYLEGKAYEILTSQLQQYLDDLNEPSKRIILRQATIEKIEKAAFIIEEELETIDNISTIANRVGLNQNTLQNGFQQLYSTSVKEYIMNIRIEKAKEFMEKSDLNISEITYKIGISSRSYFSKVFKERFGMTPKQYMNKVRNKSIAQTKSA